MGKHQTLSTYKLDIYLCLTQLFYGYFRVIEIKYKYSLKYYEQYESLRVTDITK